MKKRALWLAALVVVVLGVGGGYYYFHRPPSGPQVLNLGPLPTGFEVLPDPPAEPAKFEDLAQQAGLTYQWTLPGKTPRNILQTIGNGCAFLDFNNDGNLDILLVGPTLALYKGDGHGHFTDVTHETGLDKFHGYYLGCAVGDYDNDGYDDVFITGYNTALLLHNEAGKSFRDVTKQSGIATNTWSTSAAWADVDNSGRLDLYVCNYLQFGPNDKQLCELLPQFYAGCPPDSYQSQHGVFYHNDGHGHFTDVTAKYSLNSVTGKDLGAAFADFDGSGRQSLFVANDKVASNLFENHGKHFEDVGIPSGTATLEGGGPYSGMGVDWGDYDNDGKMDLAVMDFNLQDKLVFHNEGDGLFTNQSVSLGMQPTSYMKLSFGVKWFDYDNDGWLDLIMCEGSVTDNVEQVDHNDKFMQPTMLFHNNQGLRFDNVSKGLVGPALRPIVGRGLAIGDYDNDGRVDVLVADSAGKPLLLHNETPTSGHWLEIRLVGTKSNRDGYGAVVTAKAGDNDQVRLCHSDGSYMSSSDRRVHIGLGAATKVPSLTVRWPSGHTDTYRNVAVDQIITIQEGSSQVQPWWKAS
jgi:hypothetical protein